MNIDRIIKRHVYVADTPLWTYIGSSEQNSSQFQNIYHIFLADIAEKMALFSFRSDNWRTSEGEESWFSFSMNYLQAGEI